MANLPIALQLYTVRDQTAKDYAGTVRQVAKMGYHGVEFANPKPPHAELKALMKETGLKVAGGHEGLPGLEDNLDTLITEYQDLGCSFITLPSIPGEWREAKDFGPLFAKVDAIGKRCRERGVTLCYHNHEFEFKLKVGDKTFFDALYASTDPSHLQAQIDTYWVYFAGLDPAAVIKQYAGRCPLIHLKDMPKDFTKFERPAKFAEVGEGQVDMRAIFAASEASGAKWYIVEQDQCARPSLESAQLSLTNLKKMGKA
jgi:sugar phosphate isomerase/epimerase